MRTIFLAFLTFILSGVIILPKVAAGINLPEEVFLWGPISAMILSMLIQVDATFALRSKGQLLKELRDLKEQVDAHGQAQVQLEESAHQLSQVQLQLKESDSANEDMKQRSAKKDIAMRDLETQLQSEKTARIDAQKNQESIKEQLEDQENKSNGQLEVLEFLAALQTKGRFLDFVMSDVSQYTNDQVAGAARVVHQGCAKAMSDSFEICHVRDESEGSTVNIESGDHPSEYKLLGKVGGEAPYQGKILHRGWWTKKISLPIPVGKTPQEGRPTVITPAEVELA